MKKFVVFSKSQPNVEYQLSVSKKHIEKGWLLSILNNWGDMLPFKCAFDYGSINYDVKHLDLDDIWCHNDSNYTLDITENLCNVYFKLIKYEPSYEIREIFD